MSEIGTAYVRVRPQMSSFRAETQTGIRSAFGTVGKILLPTIAFAGVTEGIRKSVAAAELKQVVQGQLEQAFRQVGLSFSQNAPQVDAAIKNQQRLGFSFDESAQAMTRSVRATSNVGVALKLQAAAADLARGQNIGLLQATQILIRAYNGQSSGLKRLGVTVAKHSKGVEVLNAVQEKFSGSSKRFAESAAGAQQRLSASIAETEALIGAALLPTVGRLNTRLADWLDNTENQKKIQDAANKAVKVGGEIVHELGVAFNTVEPPLKSIINLLGGLGHVAESALIIGVLAKARRAALGLAGIKGTIGPLGQAMRAFSTAATGSTAAVAADSKAAADALTRTGAAGQRASALAARGISGEVEQLTQLGVVGQKAQTSLGTAVEKGSELLVAQGAAADKSASAVAAAAAREATSISAVADVVAEKNARLAAQGKAAQDAAVKVTAASAREETALGTTSTAAARAGAAVADIAAGFAPVTVESKAASVALQGTGEAGQRAAGVVSTALSGVVAKFAAIDTAATASSAKVVSAARAEARALNFRVPTPTAAPTLASRPVAAVGNRATTAAARVQTAVTSAAVLEATQFEQTLKDISDSSSALVESSTREELEHLRSLAKGRTTASNTFSVSARKDAAGFKQTGATATEMADAVHRASSTAVDGVTELGDAAAQTETIVGGIGPTAAVVGGEVKRAMSIAAKATEEAGAAAQTIGGSVVPITTAAEVASRAVAQIGPAGAVAGRQAAVGLAPAEREAGAFTAAVGRAGKALATVAATTGGTAKAAGLALSLGATGDLLARKVAAGAGIRQAVREVDALGAAGTAAGQQVAAGLLPAEKEAGALTAAFGRATGALKTVGASSRAAVRAAGLALSLGQRGDQFAREVAGGASISSAVVGVEESAARMGAAVAAGAAAGAAGVTELGQELTAVETDARQLGAQSVNTGKAFAAGMAPAVTAVGTLADAATRAKAAGGAVAAGLAPARKEAGALTVALGRTRTALKAVAAATRSGLTAAAGAISLAPLAPTAPPLVEPRVAPVVGPAVDQMKTLGESGLAAGKEIAAGLVPAEAEAGRLTLALGRTGAALKAVAGIAEKNLVAAAPVISGAPPLVPRPIPLVPVVGPAVTEINTLATAGARAGEQIAVGLAPAEREAGALTAALGRASGALKGVAATARTAFEAAGIAVGVREVDALTAATAKAKAGAAALGATEARAGARAATAFAPAVAAVDALVAAEKRAALAPKVSARPPAPVPLIAPGSLGQTSVELADASGQLSMFRTQLADATGQLVLFGADGKAAAISVSAAQRDAALAADALGAADDRAAAAQGRLTLAQRLGAAAGAQFARTPFGPSVAAAGGFGKLIGATVGKAFGAALSVYIADSIVSSFTGFSPLGALKKVVTPPPSPVTSLRQNAADQEKAQQNLPGLRLARDQAEAAVAAARVALATTKAAKGSLEYRTAVDALDAALVTLAATNKDLGGGQKDVRETTNSLAKSFSHLQDVESSTVAAIVHGHQIWRAFTTGSISDTDKFQQRIVSLIATQKDLPPVLLHNAQLVLDLSKRIHDVPDDKTIDFIIHNQQPKASLDELLAKMASLAAQVGIFSRQINADLTSAFNVDFKGQVAKNVAAGPPSLPKVFEFGKLKRLDLNRLKAETGKNQSAIKAAAQAELDQVNKTVKYLEGLKPSSAKARKRIGDALTNFYGQQASLQGEVDQVNQAATARAQAAAAKAKAAREKAAREAKAAREKAARAYQSNLSDTESSLRRAATGAKAAALRAIGLGKDVTAEQKKLFVLPGENEGLISRGNIDLLHRRVAKLAKGAIATVHSFSIPLHEGEKKSPEVLLSQVINGKLVSVKKAIESYRRTGENLGVFKTIDAANRYAERLHEQQAGLYSNLGGTTAAPPAGLIARLKAADNAEVAFYRAHVNDKNVTAAQRRTYKNDLQKALDQRKADFAAIGAAILKHKDDLVNLALGQAELAAKTGLGSDAKAAALQDQADEREKKLLRAQVARFTRRANDASLGAAAQSAAIAKANAAEDKLLSLTKAEADRHRGVLSLAVESAEADVDLAKLSHNQDKIDAAVEREKKALQRSVAADRKRANNLKLSFADRVQAKHDYAADLGKLLALDNKTSGAGFSLAQLGQYGASQFAEYGSNIAPRGAPLSPQDERAAFGKVLKRLAKKKSAPVVIQHFHNPQDPYAATRAAQLAAEHQYIGGV